LSTENPGAPHEMLLRDLKTEVRVFLKSSERCEISILSRFFGQLTDEEKQHGQLMKDNTTPHTAKSLLWLN
jgi:hypothetical protein